MTSCKSYIITILSATLLAIGVWFCVPKEYAAYTRVSDEYKETDLAIGLNQVAVDIKKKLGGDNAGINDIEIYSRFLHSNDFLYKIANIIPSGYNETYASLAFKQRDFWQTADTCALIKQHITYCVDSENQTLDIQFVDKEPYLASLMLDSVIVSLQQYVTDKRHELYDILMKNAIRECDKANVVYKKSKGAYASFMDSHQGALLESEKRELEALETDATKAYEKYNTACLEVARNKALSTRAYFSFAIIQRSPVPSSPTSNVWGYILTFVLLAVVATKWYHLYKKRKEDGLYMNIYGNVFSPWTISILLWLGIIIAIYFAGDLIYTVDPKFYYALAIWLPLFCLTSIITYTLFGKQKGCVSKRSDGLNINMTIFNTFLLLSVLCMPICVKKVLDVVTLFGSENLMANIRLLAIKGETNLGILAYTFTITKALVIVSMWMYPSIPKWKLALVILLFLMCAFVDMDKGSIFFLVINAVFVMYERGVIKMRTISILGVVMLALFFILTLMRAETKEDGTTNLDDLSFMEFIAIYVLSTPVAFGTLTPSIGQPYGSYTMTFLYLVLNKLGGNFPIIEQIQHFVWVPIPTNLYTIMQPFYLDFGYAGVAVFAVLYGFVLGYAYNRYKNGTAFGLLLYTYLLYYIVLQFGQEGLVMLPIFTIRMIFCLCLLTLTGIHVNLKRKLA